MSTYLDYSIKTRSSFKDYILRKLGAPLIKVELTDNQLDDCINDSLEEFTKYVNQEDKYIALNLSNYVANSGILLPSNVAGIFSLQENYDVTAAGDINTLGSISNIMYNAGVFPNLYAAGGWITYEIAMQHIKLSQRMTGGGFQFEYNPRDKILTLTPDPINNQLTGHIVVGCHTIRDEDKQYGESWVKRMALAHAKTLLGTIRKKFRGVQLLGGGEVDDSIADEGITEKDALMEELKEEYKAFAFFVG